MWRTVMLSEAKRPLLPDSFTQKNIEILRFAQNDTGAGKS
jgi:hypothetical protein